MPHRSSLIGSLLVCLCVIAATGWNPKGVAVASLHAAPDRTHLRIDGEPGKLVAVAELTTAEIMNPAVANRDPSFVSPRSQFRARPASLVPTSGCTVNTRWFVALAAAVMALAAFNLTTPLFGVLATALVIGEPIGWRLATSALLVAGGIAVATLLRGRAFGATAGARRPAAGEVR